jgi:hypothetical protein
VCFDFLYKFCLKHFSFCGDVSQIPSIMYPVLHVKYLLFVSDFDATLILSAYFRKYSNINFMFCWPCISRYNSCKWPTWPTILFSICLFQFSTCFEKPRAHRQENQLYQYNIWYVSLCVGDRLGCRSEISFPTCTLDGHLHRVTYTRCCIGTIYSPDDEHKVARNM